MTKTSVSPVSFDSELQRGWGRFAGPRATSQAVVLPILLFLSFNAAPAGLTQSPDVRLIQLRILFFAFVCAWTYFTVFGVVIENVAARMGRLRSTLVMVLFATTETLRTVLVHQFALLGGLESDPVWLFRITGGTATGIVFFSVLSIVVNDSQYYRVSYRELFEQRILLNASLSSAEANLTRTRDQLVQSVRDQLDKALRSILRDSAQTSSQALELSDELFHVSEGVVRPLSHQLFEIPVLVDRTELSVKPPRVPFSTFVKVSSLADPFRPVQLVFIGFLLTLPVVFLFTHPIDYVGWAGGLVLTFAVLFVAQKYLTPRLIKIPFILRVILISAIYSAPALLFAGSVTNAVYSKTSNGALMAIYGVAMVMFLGWLIAASEGMRVSRTNMLEEISHVNNELYWLGVRLQAELWVDQKNLALTLHNEVQATLLAAALKLKAASDQGEITAGVMTEVKELILRGMNFAAKETVSTTLDEAVNRLNDNWGGLITMRYTAAQETLDLLAQDPITMGVLEDVLSEFQNNSLKHGKATETTVILSTSTPGVLSLSMSNNGSPLVSGELRSGLGSTFLNSVSLSQKFENYTRGVKLTVLLPLSNAETRATTSPAK